MLRRLRHGNVVNFMGISVTGEWACLGQPSLPCAARLGHKAAALAAGCSCWAANDGRVHACPHAHWALCTQPPILSPHAPFDAAAMHIL